MKTFLEMNMILNNADVHIWKVLEVWRTELSDDYVITLKLESKSLLKGFG